MIKTYVRNWISFLAACFLSLAFVSTSVAGELIRVAKLPPSMFMPRSDTHNTEICGNRNELKMKFAGGAAYSVEQCEDKCYKKFLPKYEKCMENIRPGEYDHRLARCEYEFKQNQKPCVENCLAD